MQEGSGSPQCVPMLDHESSLPPQEFRIGGENNLLEPFVCNIDTVPLIEKRTLYSNMQTQTEEYFDLEGGIQQGGIKYMTSVMNEVIIHIQK